MKEVRHLVIGAAAVGAGLIAFASAPGPARAATVWYVAPTGSDANSCASSVAPCATINGAIAKAGVGDTVDVATGTYIGPGEQVVLVDKDLTLEGGWDAGFTAQTGASTVDAQNFHLGVRVDSAAAALDRFVIENASQSLLYPDAGGIYVDGAGASLDLSTSTVRDNKWGAIWSTGPVSVTDSTIEGNTGRYGNGGGVTVTHNAPLTVVNSTISDNTAEFGGGILVAAPSDLTVVDLSNVTIVGNKATRSFSPPASPAGYGGGIWLAGGELVLRNSIVSWNSADNLDPNIPTGIVFSDGYNIETGYPPAPTDILSSPNVEALADNGGPTKTRALLFDSPAVDGGNPAGCTDAFGDPITTDQRGVDRPLRYACDIGAFEAQPPKNDDFVDATPLVASPVSGSNKLATKEPGEPDHAADPGGGSVWYSLTPSFTGTAFVSTAGSTFDTLLGVYTGSSVSGLTTLAGNDDATEHVGTSKACFSAAAGTPYHVAVDGVEAASALGFAQGSFTLSWGQYTDPHPCAVLPPSITGTPQVSRPLTASQGTWAGPSLGFAYQWFVCGDVNCSEIPGATASTYTPVAGDQGKLLYVQVTAQDPADGFNNVPSTSALTAPVLAAPPPPPPPPPPNFTLTVTEAGSGAGTVTSSPAGIACGSVCAQSYPSGTVVTLLASASSGSKFVGWSGSVCSGTGTCVVTMSAATAVTATFTRLPKPCIVPKVEGKRLKAAERAIKSRACRVGKVSHAFSKHLRMGRVISQRPKPGKRLAHGAKVNLVVSKGWH